MLDHAKEAVPGARYLAPGHNFGSISDKIAGIITGRTPFSWFIGFLIGFIGEHLPRHGIEEALVCGPPEAADPWVDLLRDRFEIPSRLLEARDLPAGLPRGDLAFHHAAPLVAAATREVA